MAKIRVALCITDLDIGGAERCLTELAIRVDRQRFAPVVYCLANPPGRRESSCVPLLEEAGVAVHYLGGRAAWQLPIVVGRLRRLLVSQGPQIVQTFLFHANLVGRIAARRTGVKAVVSGIRVAERRSRWHLQVDRMTEGWVDRYVCVSRSVADFSASHGIPQAKVVVIPNGVDLNKYPARRPADPAAFGLRSGRRIVTFVGRLARQKGVTWLIETAPRWLSELPDCDLLLVGEGALRHRLEAACRDEGIAERVRFAGWRSDIPEILAASDLLVLPSAWEGMPNVVLEAMASRRPVVASDVEGVRELLGPAAPAQIVPYLDTQTLTNTVVRIMRERAMAAAIGAENRRRVEGSYAISRMIEGYENLWESLATG